MADEESIKGRLNRLQELRDQGVLSEAEYEAARAAALTDAATPPNVLPKAGLVPSGEPSQQTGRRGVLLTAIAIALVVALVALVAVVLATRGGDPPPVVASEPLPSATAVLLPTTADGGGYEPKLAFDQSCADMYVCPQITAISGTDLGSKIRISMDYCDRTPGQYQGFVYRFRLADSNGSVASWSSTVSKTQTWACNTITAEMPNNYSPGTWQVRATIANTDTGQETTGRSDGFRIG